MLGKLTFRKTISLGLIIGVAFGFLADDVVASISNPNQIQDVIKSLAYYVGITSAIITVFTTYISTKSPLMGLITGISSGTIITSFTILYFVNWFIKIFAMT